MELNVQDQTPSANRPAKAIRRRLPIALIALLGVACSIGLWQWSAAVARERLRLEFNARAQERVSLIIRSLEGNIDSLLALAGLFQSSQSVERDEFREFISGVLSRHPTIHAMRWAPRVFHADRARFERESLGGDATSEVIGELDAAGVRHPAAARPEYFPILYSEPNGPTDRATHVLGLDLGSFSDRLPAMMRARDDGLPRMTSRLQPLWLPPEMGDAPSVAVCMPVYAGASAPLGLEQRRSKLAGFLTMLLRLDELTETSLQILEPAGISIDLRHVREHGTERLYLKPSRLMPADRDLDREHGLVFEMDQAIAGSIWRFECAPCASFLALRSSATPGVVLGGGLVVTGLLIAHLLMQVRQRGQIERLVESRTEELAVANAELRTQVAERQRAEIQVRSLNTDLEGRVEQRTAELQAAVQELDAFAYTVSHDLRAPLRAVDGFSRIMIEDHPASLSPDLIRYLGLVRSNAQQMGQLIDDLLSFSRLGRQPISRRLVDLGAMARDVMREVAATDPERAMTFKAADGVLCLCDPTLTRQVLVNLLTNAFKFTRGRQPAEIRFGALERNGETVYHVSDNGVGFDMAYVNKLFGVFQRLHRAEEFEGTGVGLAIVRRVIERHGGRVWAHSEPDRGTMISFTIPQEPLPE